MFTLLKITVDALRNHTCKSFSTRDSLSVFYLTLVESCMYFHLRIIGGKISFNYRRTYRTRITSGDLQHLVPVARLVSPRAHAIARPQLADIPETERLHRYQDHPQDHSIQDDSQVHSHDLPAALLAEDDAGQTRALVERRWRGVAKIWRQTWVIVCIYVILISEAKKKKMLVLSFLLTFFSMRLRYKINADIYSRGCDNEVI